MADGQVGVKTQSKTTKEQSLAQDGAKKAPTKKRELMPAPAEAVDDHIPKKLKVARLTLDMFGGDAAAWFEAFHEQADSALSKLERGTHDKSIIYMEGHPWDAVKKVASKAKPEAGDGPVALIVSASADRSCIVAKDLPKCPGSIAKLFARHMKVSEQAEFLKTKKVATAVGTPNRLLKLCADKVVDLSNLKCLVVDLTVDVKSFHILNMPEVARDFFAFFRTYIATLPQKINVVLLSPNRPATAGDPSLDAAMSGNLPVDEKKKKKKKKQKKKSKTANEDYGKIIFKDDLEPKSSI